LLLSSLLLMAVVAVAADYLLPLDEGRQQYGVSIMARGAEITGVCIVKTDSEGSRGAIVNEFGIHAPDFMVSADRRKVKLLNVIAMMDRWYVRRVVKKDLRTLFNATADGKQGSGRTVTVEPDGTVTLTNTRYKLKYSLKKLHEATE
jgi:hypothetical protein